MLQKTSLKSKKFKMGFTLIELLIVIGVIGVLSGLMFMVIDVETWRGKANDTVRKKDIATIAGALERYYTFYNSYPRTVGTIGPGYRRLDADDDNLVTASNPMLKSVPLDPSGQKYLYLPLDSGQGFCVCAYLDITYNEIQNNGCPAIDSGDSEEPYSFYCMRNSF